ncbi:hypothetical protein BDV33DRAFT_168642 [Aspergillus novoparasiticus]|uniref:Uncharacterized protein n=1 Tax=Aspergillus novoparasiticus TaxID=986946 RepID=A0A5N6EZQ3_9EURO|nr:hypothetical protein BDV33DRAFT_168642 [Aspergillus novoparasiticus]
MSSTDGTISGAQTSFTGTWKPQGYEATFNGNVTKSISNWRVSPATLDPSNLEDLTGKYTMEDDGLSYIGKDDIKLTFTKAGGKKIAITGTLDTPLSERTTVGGSGTWTLSLAK